MCGRYTLTVDQEALEAALQVPLLVYHEPRYNVAPSQEAPVVVRERSRQPDAAGRLVARPLRWGLVPHWADDPAIGNRLINARAETVHEKPAFRDAFRRGRCLVPADGFYEWQKGAQGKTPYWIHRRGGGVFTFAGVSASWTSPEGDGLESYAILTTEAPRELADLHDRVPVVLDEADRNTWMDGSASEERLRALLAPPDGGGFEARAVSRRVNSPANDDPECLRPPDDGSPVGEGREG